MSLAGTLTDPATALARNVMKFRDVFDGFANTICVSETITDLDDKDVRSEPVIRGSTALFAAPANTFSQYRDAQRPQFLAVAPTANAATFIANTVKNRRGLQWANQKAGVMFC